MINRINVFGHLILDKIYSHTLEYSETLGGIANVWDGLLQLDKELLVQLIPVSIGEAIIFTNSLTSQRTGRAVLNKYSNGVVKFQEADWHHIAYINQLPNLDFLKNIKSGIISADITKESPEKCLDYLEYIDFLFISREDQFDEITNLAKRVKQQVIVHHPHGSVCSDGNTVLEYEIPEELILKKVNVLGAGDAFAASFIYEYLKVFPRNDKISEIIAASHANTTCILKNR